MWRSARPYTERALPPARSRPAGGAGADGRRSRRRRPCTLGWTGGNRRLERPGGGWIATEPIGGPGARRTRTRRPTWPRDRRTTAARPPHDRRTTARRPRW